MMSLKFVNNCSEEYLRMSKTPVMILQEVAIKHNTSVPVYTETSSFTGTHKDKFIIRVDWDTTAAVGIGFSKKEAKQNAAKKMLCMLLDSEKVSRNLILSISGSISMFPSETVEAPSTSATTNTHDHVPNASSLSPVSTSDSENAFTNYVGLLQEYCVSKNIPIPHFDVVNMSGPSHMVVFTMRCTVISHSEEASANTKKAAKQLSAKKMLQRIKGSNEFIKEKTLETCVNDLNIDLMNLMIEEPQKPSFGAKEALETYAKQKHRSNLSISEMKIENYHEVLSNLCNNIPEMKKVFLMCVCKSKICDIPDTKLPKDIISNVFDTMVEKITFKASNKYDFVIGLKLLMKPSIIQIGLGSTKKEAERQAVYKLLQFISLFLR